MGLTRLKDSWVKVPAFDNLVLHREGYSGVDGSAVEHSYFQGIPILGLVVSLRISTTT